MYLPVSCLMLLRRDTIPPKQHLQIITVQRPKRHQLVIQITADILVHVFLVQQISQCCCFCKVDGAFVLVHLVLFEVEFEDRN